MKKILPALILLCGLGAAAAMELTASCRIVCDAPRRNPVSLTPVNYSCFSPRLPVTRIGIFELDGPAFWDHGSPFLYRVDFENEKGEPTARRHLGIRSWEITPKGFFFGGRPDSLPVAFDGPKREIRRRGRCGTWDPTYAFAPILTSRKVALYDTGKRLQQDRRDDTARMLATFGVPFTRIENFESFEDFDILIIGVDSFDGAVIESGKAIRSFVENGKRLLVFPQNGDGRYPFLPELQRVKLPEEGFLPEIMQPKHPLFTNRIPVSLSLAYADTYGALILPVSPAVLQLGEERKGEFFGMLTAHLKLGKGDVILTQGRESKYYQSGPENAFHIRRMLETVLDERTREQAKEFYAAPLGTLRKMDPGKAVFIPLGDAADWDTADEVSGDGKGGYADQGKDNDLRLLPTGRQNFRGALFDISGEPDKKIAIVSTNPQRPFKAESVEIPVNDSFQRLYFCHTGAWMARVGTPVAEYIVTYETGETEKIPVISGWNIADWWNVHNAKLEDAECVWRIRNSRNVNIGVFGYMWPNPLPEKKIKSIRIAAKSHTVIGLIAITGEK